MQVLVRVALIVATLVASHASYGQEISLEDIYKDAEFSNVVISPTGAYMAVSVPGEGKRDLAILDISDPGSLSISAGFSLAEGESPRNLRWVSDERLVFESTIQVGVLESPVATGRVFAINADGSNRRPIFGQFSRNFSGQEVSVISYLDNDPDWILLRLRSYNNPRANAQYVNVEDGRMGMRMSSPLEYGGMLADKNGKVRFAYGLNERGDPVFSWRASEDAEWVEIKNEVGEVIPVAFSESGESVYFSSSTTGQLGVYELELGSQEITPVIQNDAVEVDYDGALSPYMSTANGHELLAVRFMDGRPQWEAIQDDAFEIYWLRQLEAMYADYYVHIHNWTKDGKKALVSVRSASTRPDFFILDTATPELQFFVSATPWIDPGQMATVQPVQFNARDGLELNGYLTLPNTYEEGKAIPFIILVHGQPYASRDSWHYNSNVQIFAQHGYGVLQVNYRGSSGYGDDFQAMGFREWYGKMQDDVTDGTLWAMEQGFADPERTCIAGASYGAFAAVAGITKEPDLYACAWAFAGAYDLPLLVNQGNVSRMSSAREYFEVLFGTEPEALIASSPTTHVSKITTPLLVFHGEGEQMEQYRSLVERLDEEDIPYDSLLISRDRLGSYSLETRVMHMERVLEFMKEHTE